MRYRSTNLKNKIEIDFFMHDIIVVVKRYDDIVDIFGQINGILGNVFKKNTLIFQRHYLLNK